MSTGSKTLTVIGRPKAQGSLRSFKHPTTGAVITPQDSKVTSYRGLIQDEWFRKYHTPMPFEGAVKVTIVFGFRRPDNHFKAETKSRGKRELMKDDAPEHMDSKPDIDKLSRSVLDALTGFAFVDDKQVTWLHVMKVWNSEDTSTIKVQENT